MQIMRSGIFQQDHDYFAEEEEPGSSSILGSLQAIHHSGEESLMEKTSPASNIYRADASQCVESNALVYSTELAVRNTVGAQKAAKIGSGDATVQRVNAEAGNARALLQDANVTQMYAGIAGLVVGMTHQVSHQDEEMANVET